MLKITVVTLRCKVFYPELTLLTWHLRVLRPLNLRTGQEKKRVLQNIKQTMFYLRKNKPLFYTN